MKTLLYEQGGALSELGKRAMEQVQDAPANPTMVALGQRVMELIQGLLP